MILLDTVLNKVIDSKMFIPGITIFLIIVIPTFIKKIIEIIKDKF